MQQDTSIQSNTFTGHVQKKVEKFPFLSLIPNRIKKFIYAGCFS